MIVEEDEKGEMKMDEIKIEIKYSNRTMPRIYVIFGEFMTVKNAIKATGARFSGATRRWIVNKAALEELRSKYEVKASDFEIKEFAIWCVALDRPIVVPKRLSNPTGLELAYQSKILVDTLHEMQEAYNKNDESFRNYMKSNKLA
jgi:hypothetical protein